MRHLNRIVYESAMTRTQTHRQITSFEILANESRQRIAQHYPERHAECTHHDHEILVHSSVLRLIKRETKKDVGS